MPTHLVMTSIARRIDAGTYLPHRPVPMAYTAPTRTVVTPAMVAWTTVAPYLGSALLGAALGLAYGVTP